MFTDYTPGGPLIYRQMVCRRNYLISLARAHGALELGSTWEAPNSIAARGSDRAD